MITRRVLLKFFSFIGFWPFARLLRAAEDGDLYVTFYIAGVRFHEKAPSVLAPGGKVVLRLERYEQEPCYTIYTPDRVKLGYLPRHLVKQLFPANELYGIIEASNRHALPWKRHRVKVPTH